MTEIFRAGRVAVITGGASGIGFGVAKKCVEIDMKVVISDINSKELAHAHRKLKDLGRGEVMAIQCDVTKLLSVWDLKDKVYKIWGEVAFLFNNAGLSGGWSTYNTTKSEWDLVLGVNLTGVINGLSAFVPSMVKQKTRCCVINTSSVSGLVGANSLPFTGAPYIVSKTAVTALTECLSVELRAKKTNVTAHVLMPGMIKTGILENSERAGTTNRRNTTNSQIFHTHSPPPSRIPHARFVHTTKSMENTQNTENTQHISHTCTQTAWFSKGSGLSQRSVLAKNELVLMNKYKKALEEKGMSVTEMVEKMFARVQRGDFYLVITPPEQPEAVFRALAAVRGDDIVHNRPANSVSISPMPKDTRRALKESVKAAKSAIKSKL
ncbi:hypothetical protein AAMO2058_001225500 [Amorphochlora amoebiformis]